MRKFALPVIVFIIFGFVNTILLGMARDLFRPNSSIGDLIWADIALTSLVIEIGIVAWIIRKDMGSEDK